MSASKRSIGTNGKSSPFECSDSDNESLPEIECKTCDKSFSNVNAYKQHMMSKKHNNRKEAQMLSAKVANKKLVDDLSESEDDDKYTELTCETCSKTFSGYKPYASHLLGRTHSKNSKKQALKDKMKDVPGIENDEDNEDDWMPKIVAKCSLCDKSFTCLKSFQNHLVSSLHKKKLQQQKILQKIKDDHQESDKELQENFFKACEVCKKVFSGLKPYIIHMKSLAHQKSLNRAEMEKNIKDLYDRDTEGDKYICKECKKPFTDPFSFKSHLDNNSHKKYEAKRKIMELVHSHPEIAACKTIQNNPVQTDEVDEYKLGDYILLCKMCHTCFSGPESALAHVESKKHLKVKFVKQILHSRRPTQKADSSNNQVGKISVKGSSEDLSLKKSSSLNTSIDDIDFELI